MVLEVAPELGGTDTRDYAIIDFVPLFPTIRFQVAMTEAKESPQPLKVLVVGAGSDPWS
jgi:hypothetical protein